MKCCVNENWKKELKNNPREDRVREALIGLKNSQSYEKKFILKRSNLSS